MKSYHRSSPVILSMFQDEFSVPCPGTPPSACPSGTVQRALKMPCIPSARAEKNISSDPGPHTGAEALYLNAQVMSFTPEMTGSREADEPESFAGTPHSISATISLCLSASYPSLSMLIQQIFFPSGDQTGLVSYPPPMVSCVHSPDSTS